MWTLAAALGLACRPPAALPAPPSPPREAVLWSQRDDPDALREALALYAAQPAERWTLARLTRGWVLYARHHTDDATAWDEALRWGEACLAQNPTYDALRQKERESTATAARALTEADTDCAYWTALAWEGWLSQQGASTRLLARSTAPALMARVGELSPEHFYGGVDRYWGVYYASLPPFAGQDLDRARGHLDAAQAAAPDFLANDVALAEAWATQAEDVMSFVTLLEGTQKAQLDALPAVLPENRLAQVRARTLLAAQGALFPR